MARQQKRKQQPKVAIGVAWYKPEEWDVWRATCPDFEETYAEWEPCALEHIRTMSRRGIKVRKVTIGVEAFLAWCGITGRSPDGEGRSEYVAELLEREHEGREPPGG